MNVVNRLIVVLGVLVLIAFAAMLIVLAWAYSSETIQALRNFATYWGDRETDGTRVIITLVAGFVILVGLAFLLIELAPRTAKAVMVRDVETGAAVLSTAAVERRLEQIVLSLPEVEAVRAKVAGKKRAVEVDLQVMVDPEADLATTANDVARVTENAVTQQMSVALAGSPRLRLYYSTQSTNVRSAPRPASGAQPAESRPRKVRVVSAPSDAKKDDEVPPAVVTPAEEIPPESSEIKSDK